MALPAFQQTGSTTGHGILLYEDAMASDKLAEGIRRFYADARKLEQLAQAKLAKKMAG
jgi:transaldolase